MSGNETVDARTASARPERLGAPGAEFSRVRRLARWEVRRSAELLRLLDAEPDHTFGMVGYGGVLEVPRYEDRYVIALIRGDEVTVFADGPRGSPHRYSGVALCMWRPDDPTNARWTPDDGIDDLLYRVRNHLFREAWWRHTRQWLGAEAPHGGAA